jgi:hypothetical protein
MIAIGRLRRFAGFLPACALVGMTATAAAASPPVAGDLSGTWLLLDYRAKLVPQHGAIPFTANGKAMYDKNAEQLRKDPTSDAAHSDCLPPGVSRAMGAPYPFEIFQSPGQVDFIYEVNRAYRIVLLQEHHQDPKVWDPSYMGDGIGRWEGETLVIDSSNFNANTWLDDSGLPHSDQLHLIERLRLQDSGSKLEDEITIEDPPVFAQPWTVQLLFQRQKDVSLQTDWVCGDPHRAPSGTRHAVAYR